MPASAQLPPRLTSHKADDEMPSSPSRRKTPPDCVRLPPGDFFLRIAQDGMEQNIVRDHQTGAGNGQKDFSKYATGLSQL